MPHGPDLYLPGREIVRHGHFDPGIALLVGLDVGIPEGMALTLQANPTAPFQLRWARPGEVATYSEGEASLAQFC